MSVSLWECENCEAEGNVVDLVRRALKCSEQQAEHWLMNHEPGNVLAEDHDPERDPPVDAGGATIAMQLGPERSPRERPEVIDPLDRDGKPMPPVAAANQLAQSGQAPRNARSEEDESVLDGGLGSDMGLADPRHLPDAPPGSWDHGPDQSGRKLDSGDEHPADGTTLTDAEVVQAQGDSCSVYEAFLAGLRAIPHKWGPTLQHWGVNEEAIRRFGLKYYVHRYQDLLEALSRKFGVDALIYSGVAKVSSHGQATKEHITLEGKRVRCVFSPYRLARIPHVILPYFERGRPVFLKAIALADQDTLKKVKLPAQLATAEEEPCLFNVDDLADTSRAMVFNRELHAIAIASQGFTAVSYGSLSRFSDEWIPLFEGKQVAMVVSAARAADPRLTQVLQRFVAKGQPVPWVLARRKSMPWEQFLATPWRELSHPVAIPNPESTFEPPQAAEPEPPTVHTGDADDQPVSSAEGEDSGGLSTLIPSDVQDSSGLTGLRVDRIDDDALPLNPANDSAAAVEEGRSPTYSGSAAQADPANAETVAMGQDGIVEDDGRSADDDSEVDELLAAASARSAGESPARPAPARSASTPTPAGASAADRPVAVYAIAADRVLVVSLDAASDPNVEPTARFRYWQNVDGNGQWRPETQQELRVPVDVLRHIAEGAVAAALGQTATDIPAWLTSASDPQSDHRR